jgi:hypothetical protein
MSNTLRIRSLRATALSLALIVPVAATAYAADEYGTQHETVISQAASSIPSAPLSVAQSSALSDAFKVGQNDAFGASRASPLAPAAQSYMGRWRRTRPWRMASAIWSAPAVLRTSWPMPSITPAAGPTGSASSVG